MDNESYNTCIDLVEWFESICQTVPNFELERDVFYLDGRIIQVASPAILRVNSLFIGSFGSSLFAIKRPVYPFLKIFADWMQINIAYYTENYENTK